VLHFASESTNFNNYRRVACSDSFIKNLVFTSPTLKIDIEIRKIDVTVVFLDIDVLEDAAQSFGNYILDNGKRFGMMTDRS
jgi:hypothetical protein